MNAIVFSLDLEDHTKEYAPNGRYVTNTLAILDFLEKAQIKGTFFTVGLIAERNPELIRQVIARGHELACHSYDHTPITKQSPVEFRSATVKARDLLEDCAGLKVKGYRAPVFSLTEKVLWSVDVLTELGFEYSSSVMPVRSPLYGLPQAPRHPYKWPSGLVEFPCPIGGWSWLQLPFLGGIYLRYIPSAAIDVLLKKAASNVLPWVYCHPYDFDYREKFSVMPDTHFITSTLLWFNRRGTYKKISRIFENKTAAKFESVLTDDFSKELPAYSD